MPNKIAHKEASMSAERSSSPSSRRSPPLSRLSRLGLALSLMLGAVGVAQAQSLQELYEAARGYDASYLAARSLAESVQYRVEQSRALLRPSASLSGGVSRINSEGTAPTSNTNGSQIGVTAAYPLFNRANSVTVEQAVKQLDLAKAQLDSAEQDLIVRVAQAYFDVLAARTRSTPRAPARPPSPSSWPRPSATSRSAPPPSPTRAKPRRATTWPPRRRSPPRTTCASSACARPAGGPHRRQPKPLPCR
jgi:hypothetical protein